MKKRLNYIVLMILMLFTFGSCKKYLNTVPTGLLVEDSIFTSLTNTNAYLAQVYANLPDEFYQRFAPNSNAGPWMGASDEANNYSQLFIMSNQLNQSSWDATVGGTYWSNFYKPIRTATDFIAKIDGANSVEVSDFLKAHFKGEARALRAIYYFWMLRLYGPIPILSSEIDANATGDAIYFARTPFDSCVSYISNQLDTAYNEIESVSNTSHPADQPISIGSTIEYGRITSGVCKAYKEQVLMLAASPLFNGNSDYASLRNTDGTQLIPQTYDANKWKTAAAAAKAFIDEFDPVTYSLYTSTGSDSFTNAYNACKNVVTTEWNSEWIWGRANSSFGTLAYDITPKLVGYNSSVQKGGGFLAVNQSMVDAYFMKNGRTIDDPQSGYQTSGTSMFKSPYDVQTRSTFNQWVGREPRFYVGVTYNNSYWMDQGSSSDEVIVNYELHGNSGRSQSTTDVSSTGYNVRKHLTVSHNSRSWCYIRLAEIYLDYVEALNESDPGNTDILKYLNLIRIRAGIPAYGTGSLSAPGSQTAMRTAIWHERQIELAFEDVRYFDIRRWKIAAQTMGQDVYGMNVYADGDAFYTKTLAERRRFLSRDYLWPIPNSEILKDKLLIQNPGW
ncbi:RagB/SusD family nutrient uptake outer membrane protein [Rhizosphaericola mali]|uniref:RagB/SusD family nutrient uptake outer membrane protein n=1 Tax=Rhizosphaericola mali TaxID=2545455 RepID=A0A5P2FZ98_9BACT|nr:RagB/SusD family nutrient uptake outer membrane protein [Rhizosphaericola mali]QES87139.1 RagB/SusD family nutrient uptake outer membrane protein [Rhizosphaericola mali]